MKVLIICFFALFFVISIIGIIVQLYSICRKSKKVIISLYDDGEYETDLSKVYVDRLADTSVRSSVRYHKGLYKTYENFEQYRDNIMRLTLP